MNYGGRILSGVFLIAMMGCSHRTALSDPKLSKLWAGYPLEDQVIQEAKEKWPNEKTLLDIQQGLDILRRSNLTQEEIKRSEMYLESAFNTFEDLKDPENFSKAFTSDSKTPFRGKPYERMVTAIFLGLIDASQKRCDRAIPAFRAAEFLDARWQSFMFGSDAPMIYALTWKCQIEYHSAQSDQDRTREGLEKALRLQILLEPLLEELSQYAAHSPQDLQTQIALSLLEVGLPSALLVAPIEANLGSVFSTASSESMRFLSRMLQNQEEPYYGALKPKLQQLKNQNSAIEIALQNIEKRISSRSNLSILLKKPKELVEAIERSIQKPIVSIYFEGIGPELKQEGQYGEITQIVPGVPSYAIPGVLEKQIFVSVPCGISNPDGNLIFTMCRNPVSGSVLEGGFRGLKLWSSSFQAMTTAGRRFDKILKGRAQFRMGTEIAALIGAYTAMTLLNSKDSNARAAGAVVGAVALGVWLLGKATNPEADIRQVAKNIESGYLLLR